VDGENRGTGVVVARKLMHEFELRNLFFQAACLGLQLRECGFVAFLRGKVEQLDRVAYFTGGFIPLVNNPFELLDFLEDFLSLFGVAPEIAFGGLLL
jgi:hypothetical protein